MEKAAEVKEKARELISEGEKPSARRIAGELEMHESNIHRCLNYLERNSEIRTSSKKVFGTHHRMISVYR